MLLIALVFLSFTGSVFSYSPAYNVAKWEIGDVFSPEEKQSTMEKVWKADRQRLKEHGEKVSSDVVVQDIKNAAGNGVVLNPKLFNIFRGNTWTTIQKNLVDNMAKYVGASPYGAILSTFYNPAGTKISPITFVGSAQDSSEAPGQTGVDPNSKTREDIIWVIAQLQKYVTAKKVAVAGDFDLANFDLPNTIFTLFLASGYNFVTTPPYCGWHNAIPVTYNGQTKQILVSFMIQGGDGLAISCNSFGVNMGVGQINPNNVVVGPTSPNGDPYLESAMSAYIHEIYETSTDPLLGGVYSWYDNDDDHYSAIAPTFKARGGNNEVR